MAPDKNGAVTKRSKTKTAQSENLTKWYIVLQKITYGDFWCSMAGNGYQKVYAFGAGKRHLGAANRQLGVGQLGVVQLRVSKY